MGFDPDSKPPTGPFGIPPMALVAGGLVVMLFAIVFMSLLSAYDSALYESPSPSPSATSTEK